MQTQQETEPVITLDQVNKRYGFVQALSDISIKIPAGVTGLLGPNGAGKTTLIKILLGVIRVTSGKVSVFGMPIGPSTTIFRNKMGYVPEDDCYLTGLTGVETVLFSAQMAGITATEGLRRSHEMLDFCGVMQERYRAVETYSTGMRQKIRFAAAIVHDPPLLILDEPTSGLDPEEREAMLHRIRLLASNQGKSIIISTHILPDVKNVCDQVVILGQGRVVGEGDLTSLLTPITDSWEVAFEGSLDDLQREITSAGWHGFANGPNTFTIERSGIESSELFTVAARAGVQIRSLKPAQRSLEQFFLQAVESQNNDHS